MGADKSATIVPGHGTLFVSDTNQPLPADNVDDILEAFSLTGEEPAGFSNLGHTSKDNLPAFTKDGGDKTTLDSWLADGISVIYAANEWGLTVNDLQVDQLGLDMAFGGSFDDDGGYIVPSSNPGLDKGLFLFMTDGTGSLGFWMPNTSNTLGDAPSIDPTKFFELPLAASILTADSDVIPAASNGLPGIMKVYKNGLVIAAPKIKAVSPTGGAAGAAIEIKGSGFTGATGASGVKFGATPAGANNYQVIDDELIVASVPTGLTAGSTPITVTTTRGTSNAQAFTAS